MLLIYLDGPFIKRLLESHSRRPTHVNNHAFSNHFTVSTHALYTSISLKTSPATIRFQFYFLHLSLETETYSWKLHIK